MIITFDKEKFTKERVMAITFSPLLVKAFVKASKSDENTFVNVYADNNSYLAEKKNDTEEMNWVVEVTDKNVKFIN